VRIARASSYQICFGMSSFERLLVASANINNPGSLRIQRHRAQRLACEFIRYSI